MIHRAEHKEQFLTVSNTVLRDRELSLTARGLLAFMLTHADDWNFSFEALALQAGATKYELRQTLKELQAAGYIRMNQEKTQGGKFAPCSYEVFEQPRVEIPHTEKPCAEIPHTEKPHAENRLTEIEPYRKPIIRKPNIRKPIVKKTNMHFGEFENVFLAEDEFTKLAERIGETERDGLIEELSYYLCNHPRKYKNHYATLLAWARKREKERQERKAPAAITGNPFEALAKKEGYL